MVSIQHVFRRGAIYWWRRRLVQKVGESGLGHVAVSLLTSEPSLARTIAAHLTLESDRLLSGRSDEMLSAQQTKSILTTVARDHLQKLRRVALLELSDGVDAAEGRRMDLVTGWAMRLRAARGPKAEIGAADRLAMANAGLTDDDMADVRRTMVTLVDRRIDTGVPPAKVVELLRSVEAPQSPGDVAEAQQLMQRAQAAALLAVDERWSIIAREDEDLIAEVTAKSNPTVEATPTVGPTLHVVGTLPSCVQAEPVTNPTQALPIVTISSLTKRLIEEKGETSDWREKTQRQVGSVSALFVKMLGADDVSLVSQSAVADYKSLLLKLPKSYGKNPADFDKPLADVLRHAKTLKKDEVGRQGSTLNRHLAQLKSIIEHIEACGQAIGDFKGVSKLRAASKTRPRNARAAFSSADIKSIFRAPPWIGCASEDERLTPGPIIIHDSLYWIPLLGKATLARREELCGLDVDEVGIEEGIPYIDIRPDNHRLLKNDQSNRQIPLIEEIVRLGFLRYRDAIKALGHRLLFPELQAASDRTPYGDVYYGEWVKVRDYAVPNAQAEKKSFHSFRKTSGNDLKAAKVIPEIRRDILGHAGKNDTEETYALSARLAYMLECLNKLPDFTSHLVAADIRLRRDVTRRKSRAAAKPRRR